jgi:hypothetical protein
MASPRQPDDPHSSDPVTSPPAPDGSDNFDQSGHSDHEAPRVLRLRIAAWDVVCTVVLLVLLIFLATATNWPNRLFGFLANVCEGETCGPVPYGVDLYIRPVVWGGIGAAIAAAGIGPFVSLLKGWYMSFWPVVALAVILVSSVAGSMLTIFSERYWL